ncbi:MAG: cob(I)yrinic acid a,c-diamide adenosyltransferase [Firmicutes bacterium]|jgi:cob(I)alamin adenosyltransferase|uniref:Corrinoid adenosyltransferase n=1 Tax=Sulfobacillus benefaciens TaxID=453960 RepID=A0A2T2X6T9_9FIRM|nr:cob(I)yrinic acid a,c-diamide adenosyltransferase [Bacillota bacterium]MCL5013850.1 cob(I)yrinic acid a,c-diamide adenosyltransferase [Bacillota bacterium]PSR30195.1 MAG: ATP:cob(I)alamin adenosyltransferase [Sulfobacillus benefaciens]
MPSRLYTRNGDGGITHLSKGKKIEKHSQRVNAYGTLYELNAFIGQARAYLAQSRPQMVPNEWETLEQFLHDLQHRLFMVGRDLSTAFDTQSQASTPDSLTKQLEQLADLLRNNTPPWKPFTIPEGSLTATSLYICTTVCRRAEREIWALNKMEKVPHPVLTFINRLSDVLFAASRYVNAQLGVHEEATRVPDHY